MTQPINHTQDHPTANGPETPDHIDATQSTQPPSRRARIHLVIGPVGAGKSTYTLQLARQHRAVRLNLDDWMAELFSQDRPPEGNIAWYIERTQRCIAQIWKITQDLIELGMDVVLEIGLIQRHERDAFYTRVDRQAIDLTVYVLDAPRDVRRLRVQQRNTRRGATFSMEVPPHIFELASDLWEPPMDVECSGRDVRFIDTVSDQCR